jgi:hypothetical protein
MVTPVLASIGSAIARLIRLRTSGRRVTPMPKVIVSAIDRLTA